MDLTNFLLRIIGITLRYNGYLLKMTSDAHRGKLFAYNNVVLGVVGRCWLDDERQKGWNITIKFKSIHKDSQNAAS
jgi:hypothetical protein